MPIYNDHKKSDDERWQMMLWREEVFGVCQKCKAGKRALWTIYGDNTEILRCLRCNSTSDFIIDSTLFNDPKKFPPFLSEDVIEQKKAAWDSKYSKGYR